MRILVRVIVVCVFYKFFFTQIVKSEGYSQDGNHENTIISW